MSMRTQSLICISIACRFNYPAQSQEVLLHAVKPLHNCSKRAKDSRKRLRTSCIFSKIWFAHTTDRKRRDARQGEIFKQSCRHSVNMSLHEHGPYDDNH